MKISVVIPSCNRVETLATCLGKLAPGAQTLSADHYETLVTDDSRDFKIRDMMRERFPWAQWTQGPRCGPAANRNNGAAGAQGEWIAFVDDDCEPDAGWLEALAGATDGVDVVEGKTVCPGKTDHPLEEQVENLTGENFWSCNLAVRRDVFEKLGRFDKDFLEAGGEDMEFAWRLRREGVRTRFCPAALVNHPPRWIGWRGLWKRTWMIRWIALYRLKTGVQTPLAVDMCADLLRTTVHLVTRFDRDRWRSRLFLQAWKWLTFPLVLPYLVAWEFHFRRGLNKKAPHEK